MDNLQKKILDKIKAGEIDMKPRWHFLLMSSLYVVGTSLLALIVVYLLSFVVYILHQNGVWFAPSFGFRGLSIFIISSPWLLIGLTLLFLLLLYTLVRHYSFSYKQPLLYSMLAVVLLVLLGSFTMHQANIHERFEVFSERHNVPGFAPLYRAAQNEKPNNVTLGTVEKNIENGLILKTMTNETLSVAIDGNTKQKPGEVFNPGDKVIVFGNRVGDTINALGIRPIDRVRQGGINRQEGQVIRPLLNNKELPPSKPFNNNQAI